MNIRAGRKRPHDMILKYSNVNQFIERYQYCLFIYNTLYNIYNIHIPWL